MKAIRAEQFGEPEVMRVQETAEPSAGPGQVVVRVKAAGVNPVDTYIRAGAFGYQPKLPYTPGMDAAGIIEAVGSGVTRVAKGDRVYVAGSLSGTYAELTLCEEKQVHPLSESVRFAQGAAVGVPYATAYRGLFQRGGAIAGETVLIHGATGGVGTAAIQLARAAGLTVIGTGGTDRGRTLLIEQGAHHALAHHAPAYLDKLMDLTAGRGVDLILEMLANVNLANDCRVLAPRGRIVVIGSRGTVEIDPRELMMREADVRGLVVLQATDAERATIHAGLIAGLANGTLRPIVGSELSLAQAAKAHHDVIEAKAYGKIVLIP